MSINQSGVYPKVTEITFDSQKFHSRTRNHALILHAYLCLAVSWMMRPFNTVFSSAREQYASFLPVAVEAAPVDEKNVSAFRPVGADAFIKIHSFLAVVWNVLTTPFRYLSDMLSETGNFKLQA